MNLKKIFLGIVIPVYNEEGNIKALHSKIKDVLNDLGLISEILFVDDGSTDSTLRKLKSIASKDKAVRILTFHKNFGKANALEAGFKNVNGDIIITMDGDLQDDPEEIPRFIRKLESGYDLVSGWKYHRKDPIGKKIPSRFYNFLIRKLTGVNIHDSNCGFKAYRREVIDMVDVYGEFHRYIPIIAYWRGFRVGEIKVKHHKRVSGRSKYGPGRLCKGFMDLITISFLTKYGRSPIYLFGTLSALTLGLSVIGATWTVIDAITSVTGIEWVFGLGSLMLFLSSLFFLSIGLFSESILLSVGHEIMTKNQYREI